MRFPIFLRYCNLLDGTANVAMTFITTSTIIICEAVLAFLEKGMIRGICLVFLFGLDVAIFMPQGCTVFSVLIQNCSRFS